MEKKCRISNTDLVEVFSLGELCVSDFIKKDDNENKEKYDLTLMLSPESGLLQLKNSAPKDKMWGKYWYRSGINSTMVKDLEDVVNSTISTIKWKPEDIWLDIACNDGTMLGFVPKEMFRVGIDPAEDSFKNEAQKNADIIIQDYFSAKVYNEHLDGKKAKFITIIAMFYDLDDPLTFLDDINAIMDDDGILVLQLSYTPLMLKQLAFDNICHEHICYYSLSSLKYLLEQKNLEIVDVALNDVNGGSFRVFIRKKEANINNFKTAPYRDVANFRIESLLEYEKSLKLNDPNTYINFYDEICLLKTQTLNLINKIKKEEKTIWGYGASTKGNTLLQWFGLDNNIIDGIAERSSYKFGLKTIGTNIPIYSEEDMRKCQPDYLLILPWHFVNEFKQREVKYLKNNGKFIIPCPKLQIY